MIICQYRRANSFGQTFGLRSSRYPVMPNEFLSAAFDSVIGRLLSYGHCQILQDGENGTHHSLHSHNDEPCMRG